MKLKLIQGGGFLGRTQSAEEEISDYPSALQECLDNAFLKLQNTSATKTVSPRRDDIQYFLEYKGNRVTLSEDIVLPKELDNILNKLKKNLHY